MKSKFTQTTIHLQGIGGNVPRNLAAINRFNPFKLLGLKLGPLVMVLSLFILSTSQLFAQIALRASATATTTNTSLIITKPTGVVSGDIMIANISQLGNNTTAPTLTGWTLINGVSLGGTTLRYGAVLYKLATGSEGANYTFTLGAGTTSAVGGIVAFSGVDGTTPFDVANGSISVSSNSTAAVAAASKTTVTANTAVVMFGMAAGSAPTWSGWTTSTPGALTELYDAREGANTTVGAAWAAKPAIGATGAGAATLSAAERNGGILIALRPASVASTTFTSIASGNWSASGTWDQAGAPTANSNVVIASGFTVTVDGATNALVNLTINGTLTMGTNTISGSGALTLAGTGTLNVGGASNFPSGFATTTLNTSSTVNYNGAVAQAVSAQTYSNLTLSGNGAKTTTGATVNGILSMEGTATTTGTIATYGAGITLQYKGTGGAQTTGTEFPATFSGNGGVIINNASGVILNAARTISSSLTLTSGNLTTTSGYLLTITNTSASAISSVLPNYISGPVVWTLPANLATGSTYNFPVGKGGVYYPFSLVNPTTGTGVVTARVEAFNTGPAGGSAGTGLTSISNSEYWQLTPSGNFTNSFVSLTRQLAITPLDAIGGSGTQGGAYASLAGTAGTYGVTTSNAIGSNTFFVLARKSVSATTFTSIASGNWSASATWDQAGAPTASSNVVIPSGFTVTVDGATNALVNLTVNGSLTMGTNTITGSGIFLLGGTGILNVGGASNFPSGFATTTLNTSSTVNYNGAVAQAVSAQTYSNLILSGTTLKTFPASTTVNGTLSVQATATVAGTSPTYGGSAILEYRGGVAQTTTNTEFPNTMGTDVVIDNTNGVTLNAAKTSSGTLTLTTGNLNLNALSHSFGSITGSGTVTSGSAGAVTLTVGGDNTSTTYSGVIQNGSGTVSLTKAGTGVLTLSGTSTYTGATTISAGTLRLGAAGSGANGPLGTVAGATSVTNGACLDLNGITLATAEPLTLNGTGISNAGALTNSSGTAATFGGAITLASASIIGATGNITSSGVVSGAFALTKIGAGTLTFSGNNTFSGGLTISAGTVELGAADRLAGLPVTLSGGTFSTGATAGFAETVGTLALTANSTIKLGTYTSGTHPQLNFTASNLVTWTSGTILTINGWTGTAGVSGTGCRLFVGTAAGTLSPAQLAQIRFTGYSTNPATLLSSGELVPPAIVTAPNLAITGSTSHGSSCVGVAATPITYTITNTGGAASGVLVYSNSVQFVVSGAPSSIAGNGGTATYTVTFTPGSVGDKTCSITVECTPVGNSPVYNTLTGTGMVASAGLSSSAVSNTICAGDPVTFTATGGNSYQFFVDGTSQNTPGATPTFITSALTDGQVVTVRVINASLCAATSTGITTTVNPLPQSAPITGIETVSVGGVTTLGNPVSGGIWSSGTEAVATVNSSGEVLGVSVGTSVIRYTVSNGTCSTSTTLTVTVSEFTGINDLKDINGMGLNNYPNPFTGNTTISYTLPTDGRVTLTIRNLAGQKVKTVIDDEMESKGDYTQIISADDMKSGVYFGTLSLKNNGKEVVKTIRLLKGK